MEIRAEFCRCTGARFWRSCHQSRVNERSESNRRHQASLSTFEVQGAAGRAVAIARCSVRRHRASCSSLDLSKTSSASVARTGPKKSHSEIISLSALPGGVAGFIMEKPEKHGLVHNGKARKTRSCSSWGILETTRGCSHSEPPACWRAFQKHCFSSPDFAFCHALILTVIPGRV